MTRRQFLSAVPAAAWFPTRKPERLAVPLRIIVDSRTNPNGAPLKRFWSRIWPQTAGDFEACGIHLDTSVTTGEVRRSPGGKPIFVGLDRHVLNLVVTDQIPMQWDRARALSGVTTHYQEYFVCIVALNYAHPHQIPFLSVNTCLHELLHAFLSDIFEDRPAGVKGNTRELRVDWYATRMWLFHDGAQVRRATKAYVERIRAEVAARS